MRIRDMTWMQVEEYLAHDDRCVLPLGSVEQHAYLSLAVDMILSERMAVDAAAPLGVPVFPSLPYGLTPYFMGYPGTITLTPATYGNVVEEILDSLFAHGFRRILIVNGHGGNREARPVADTWSKRSDEVKLVWHDWWCAPETMAAVRALDPDASHASWMEGFEWTRVPGVTLPDGHKDPVDLTGREGLTGAEMRARLGDGSFGGDYIRSAEDEHHIWDTGVRETRRKLEGGW